MKRVVIGTAGHVDHGKTWLTRALTGVDTDRLPEEKRRGLTIEPGFAPLALSDEILAGVADVPGHEAFISNMLAGAAGVDLLLLCVDATEGFKPQTREHVSLCALLGISHGILVLTKADLLDADGLARAVENARREVRGTFLEAAPILPVSALTGAGLQALRSLLTDLAEQLPPKSGQGPFRLHLDRVFSVDGFGTVVTGTAATGTVAVGDTLRLYPGEKTFRVRGLQSHGVDAARLTAGARVALNLAGAERSELRRGDTLASPGSLTEAEWADAELTLLKDAPFPLKSGGRLRLHHGTRAVLCRCALRGLTALMPGETCAVRLRFEQPLAAREGDRFVVRFLSPARTAGGGALLALNPVKRPAPEPPEDPEQRALHALEAHHTAFPLEPGMSRAALEAGLPAGLLDAMAGRGLLRLKGPYAFLPGFRPKYTPELAKIRDRLELAYRRAGYALLSNKVLEAAFGADAPGCRQVVARLLRDGVLLPLDGRRRIHREALDRARAVLLRLFEASPRVALAQYRDALGCGRDAALRLLEYWDREGLTRREEGGRVLLKRL